MMPITQRWNAPSGETIKALRRRLGLTQVKFAERYGLDLNTLENWEQERRQPDRAAVVLLRIIEQDPQSIARMIQTMDGD